MPLKPCLGCGRLGSNSRCPECAKRKRAQRPYTWTERQRRAQAVEAWVQVYGYLCPGWRRDAHESTDLTADHITPVAAGGREDGPLAILCRACNSAKRDRVT